MIKYLCYVFLLLLMVLPVMATPYEQKEEYKQKQAILNERAARFKAETGFEGTISFNHQYMSFSRLSGSFKDIVVSAPQDTVFMRQVFEQVVSKVLPYIPASEGQLFIGNIMSNQWSTGVRYLQKVNGYNIENAGLLTVSYSNTLKTIAIMDNTVEVASFVVPTVSSERAMHLYHSCISQDDVSPLSKIPPTIKLVYFNINLYSKNSNPDFRLCWVIGGVRFIVLDAVTETIYVDKFPSMIHDNSANLSGAGKDN